MFRNELKLTNKNSPVNWRVNISIRTFGRIVSVAYQKWMKKRERKRERSTYQLIARLHTSVIFGFY